MLKNEQIGVFPPQKVLVALRRKFILDFWCCISFKKFLVDKKRC